MGIPTSSQNDPSKNHSFLLVVVSFGIAEMLLGFCVAIVSLRMVGLSFKNQFALTGLSRKLHTMPPRRSDARIYMVVS
jgi:hypothetical protein